jgi:hypothetical protein
MEVFGNSVNGLGTDCCSFNFTRAGGQSSSLLIFEIRDADIAIQ